jgi:hypothetical protein
MYVAVYETHFVFHRRFEELYSKRIQQSLRKKALAQEQVPTILTRIV